LIAVDISRRLVAEAVGTALLLAAIVGSGIMAERLSGGNEALALLCNSTATGAILVVLISVFGQVSGAHLNPAVTLAFAVRREIGAALAVGYVLAQVTGAVLGTWAAHVMFDENVLQVSTKARAGSGLWFAEALATFGLILTILGTQRWKADMVPVTVGLYIASAYWFTASTSFANPAVTLARSITNTFAGIQPAHAPAFIVAQLVGVLAGTLFCWFLFAQVSENANRRLA
jgi:glycerol uptake facilitator-like aquaporin